MLAAATSVRRARTTFALIATYLLMRSCIIVLVAKVKSPEYLIASRLGLMGWTRQDKVEYVIMMAWNGVTGKSDY